MPNRSSLHPPTPLPCLGSTWNSDTSAFPGPPRGSDGIQVLVNGPKFDDILLLADSITLAYSAVDGYAWGSGVSGVYQINITDDRGAEVINTLFRDVDFSFHGAYALIAADGTYFAAARTSIQGYHNAVPFDFTSPIVKTKEYFVPGLEEDEHLVGLSMTYDAAENAFLVFATTRGQVGAVSLDFSTPSNLARVPGIESVALPSEFMSNSIALDGPEGGIYVCTSRSIARMRWDPATVTIATDWVTDYGAGSDPWMWGRIGPGCGSSPTMVGPVGGVAEYTVITDGESPMNIRFYEVC